MRAGGPNEAKTGGRTETRVRAEKRLGELGSTSAAPSELPELVQELRVHQIELELQNEDLRQARAEREETARVYTELYDLAPVAYFTLGRSGVILRSNLAGASLLGTTRSVLKDKLLRTFVAERGRGDFDANLARIFGPEAKERESFELVLQPRGGGELFVRMDAVVSEDRQVCRAALFDLTENRRSREELRRAKLEEEDANRAKSE